MKEVGEAWDEFQKLAASSMVTITLRPQDEVFIITSMVEYKTPSGRENLKGYLRAQVLRRFCAHERKHVLSASDWTHIIHAVARWGMERGSVSRSLMLCKWIRMRLKSHPIVSVWLRHEAAANVADETLRLKLIELRRAKDEMEKAEAALKGERAMAGEKYQRLLHVGVPRG